MTASPELHEPADVLYRIKRGLSGYVSYLAACEMNESFSEYVLYEPILRILTARHYLVECEVECPGVAQPHTGDRKRLDFVASRDNVRFAVEVKWAQSRSIDVSNDHSKMAAFLKCGSAKERAFLCVFGRESHIGRLALKPHLFEERGHAVVARFGKTRYGCRIYPTAYDRFSAEIESEGRVFQEVWVYTVREKSEFVAPSRDYLDIIRRAAGRWGFPKSYRDMLDRIEVRP